MDAAHRVRVRVEDTIRTGNDCGIGKFPSESLAMNLDERRPDRRHPGWPGSGCLRLLVLDGQLARAEPRTLRYQILHAAARLTRGGRRRRLKIQATWPGRMPLSLPGNESAHYRRLHDKRQAVPAIKEGAPGGPWNPGRPARQAGGCHPQEPRNKIHKRPVSLARHARAQRESSRLTSRLAPQNL